MDYSALGIQTSAVWSHNEGQFQTEVVAFAPFIALLLTSVSY